MTKPFIYRMEDDIVFVKTKNNEFMIDKCDLDFVSQYKWHISKNGYVVRNTDKKSIHRLLLNPGKSQIVDHINRNKLDNRRNNLRIADYSINNFNRKLKGNISGEPYIMLYDGYYRVVVDGKYIGCSKDKEKAIAIRNQALQNSNVMKYNKDLQKMMVETP